MPLPVAHSLAGGTVYLALDGGDRFLTWRWLALSLVIANAPDLDFLPGFAVGEPNHYHHGVVHSLGALVIVLIVTALVAAAGWRWPLRLRSRFDGVLGTVLIVGLLWSSHLLLDALTEDFREPFGVPLLWPLSDGYYQIWPWFPYVERLRGAGGTLEFFASLFTAHNLWAIAVEVMTLAPGFLVVAWWRACRGPQTQAGDHSG